ncbi:AraC family transcriptional regulator [Arthrobacter sp. ISL-69]|uniref:AraC family transcriptional regulator n=1 Tax=Arthrobacter sp. ISL-69 TaxID=2819113 RepID=UPI001BEB1E5C|nr:AraC family transcriptional regulator [Arthrobacter sp. ISL-69]MBT2538817.1 AraC family transcriptional regulator [Arthrobacter sp. ISL-69]
MPDHQDDHQPDRRQEALRRILAGTIDRWTKGSEDIPTAIPGLSFFRREAPTEPGLCQIEPSVVLAVQGAKRILVGEGNYAYDSRNFLIASLDIPASSQVLDASPERPCLGLIMQLDLRMLAELGAQTHLPPPKDCSDRRGVALGTVTPSLLEPFKRLTDLLEEPEAIEALAPLVLREIHYRLLDSDQSGRLRQLTAVGSQSFSVARAIGWLKANYASQLRIEELADRVHMSPSSFHHHFRLLTAMTPLQYQKWLRLHEARRLMLTEGCDATSAAYEVGYESPSQFSREYSKLFGAPPRRDVIGLRRNAVLAAH